MGYYQLGHEVDEGSIVNRRSKLRPTDITLSTQWSFVERKLSDYYRQCFNGRVIIETSTFRNSLLRLIYFIDFALVISYRNQSYAFRAHRSGNKLEKLSVPFFGQC